MSNRRISQGTISVLVGCHSIFHSLWIILAWKKIYKTWPHRWEIVCIFLHDIGHLGIDYLDSAILKTWHWVMGARLAYRLYGDKGFMLVAGHCPTMSRAPESKLLKPDLYSHLIAPRWWQIWNTWVEPKLNTEGSSGKSVDRFRERLKEKWDSGQYEENHNLYLERTNGR